MQTGRARKEIILDTSVVKRVKSVLVLILILIIVLALQRAYSTITKPDHVWNDLLTNTLSTKSVTKRTLTSRESESIEQITQISFLEEPRIHAVVELKQKNQDNSSSKIVTETITTRQNDYSRYVSIHTGAKNPQGKPISYRSVEGLWGKGSDEELAGLTPAQNLQRAVIGLVPVANIPEKERSGIINDIISRNIYEVDQTKTVGEKVNDRAVWTFVVKVKIADYIPILKKIFPKVGLGDIAYLDEASYSSAPAEELKISVDKFSHQLVQLKYNDGSSEQFSGHGLRTIIQDPAKTIPLAEIQQKLQAAQEQ